MDVTLRAGDWCPELILTADQVTTVRFADEDVATVEVIVIETDGDRVRWTCDGSTPNADHGWFIPLDGVDSRQPPTSGPTVVKLWTSGTAIACVQRGE